jgi:averantin hydroxylase
MRQRGYQHTKLLELHEKYGKVVRVAPNELSWIDEGVLKDVWAHRQGHHEFMKDRSAGSRHPNGHFGILFAEREDHSRYRRLLSHSFSDKGMREQEPIIASYVDSLLKGLREESENGEAVDMVKWFNACQFEINDLGFADNL